MEFWTWRQKFNFQKVSLIRLRIDWCKFCEKVSRRFWICPTMRGGGVCLGLEVITHHNNFLRGSNDDNPPVGLLSFKLRLIHPIYKRELWWIFRFVELLQLYIDLELFLKRQYRWQPSWSKFFQTFFKFDFFVKVTRTGTILLLVNKFSHLFLFFVLWWHWGWSKKLKVLLRKLRFLPRIMHNCCVGIKVIRGYKSRGEKP